MNGSAVMIVGTDTGVGKTFVAVRLVRALRRQGLDVGVMKPFESGISARRAGGVPLGLDATRLLRAAGSPNDEPTVVSPYRFHEALAPAIAATRAKVRIDYRSVERAYRALVERHCRVVIESAGGLYSPLGPGCLHAVSLAKRLGIAVVLVAANRLGVLSHVFLAREALTRHGVPLRAIVLTRPTPAPRLVRETNATALPYALNADARIGGRLAQALGW